MKTKIFKVNTLLLAVLGILFTYPSQNYADFKINSMGIESDYMRVVLAFASFYFMQSNYKLAAFLYLLSGFLDAIDGHFARALNQGSKLGAMLDVLTDRITTMCLLAALCHFYPKYMIFFQLSMALDIFSHWLHLHSTNMKEARSDEGLDLSVNPVLRHYYHKKLECEKRPNWSGKSRSFKQKMILFCLCAGNELFYCLLYINYFTTGPIITIGNFSMGIYTLIMYVCAPISIFKSFISITLLIAACQNIAAIDLADREEMKKRN